jgi:hypothetical protein
MKEDIVGHLGREDAPQTALIRITLEYKESGYIFAKSPDLKGLLVGAESLEVLERRVPIAIMDLAIASEEEVFLLPIRGLDPELPVRWWVKIPRAAVQNLEAA